MKTDFLRRVAVLLAATAGAATVAQAYVVYTDDSGVYTVKWYTTPVAMQVKLNALTTLSDGTTPAASVVAATRAWNQQLGTVQFSTQTVATGTNTTGNGVNEIVMSDTVDGDAFPTGALAITLTHSISNSIVEADLVFNNAYTWDSYRGALQRTSEDIRRVATHELGHVLGLDHPDENGQTVTALMNSHVSNLDALQADDIEGGQKLYGAPGVHPVNDAFADATAVTTTDGSGQWTGSNIGGSAEDHEPLHGGSTGAHSVWWKWTPSTAGTATATTFGSDFDTVLGVYTGSSVGALTTIASNDDEESSADNPTTTRKRTSKVVFSAEAGTTYYFAVDGWGDAEGVPAGFTGSVVLNIAVTAQTAPVFTTQPFGQSIADGQSASFTVAAVGTPGPTLQWQVSSDFGAHWSNLSNGGAYAGVTTATLSVAGATAGMNGTQYRCVATNSFGSVNSNAASLYITGASTTRLVNIATRAYCGTGDNLPIGGFVIAGSGSKRVLIRAVGPTLATQGLSASEVLADPTIELHHGADPVVTNDNWGDNANAAEITSVGAQIGANPLASGDTRSAALLVTLQTGVYTFIVHGKNDTSGIVLLEVYDADTGTPTAKFVNIATRAYATTGNGVAIGGFVITGGTPKWVLMRAVGPTLSSMGLGGSGLLTDPLIELHHGSLTIANNDNWRDNGNVGDFAPTGARIGAFPIDATDTTTSAILAPLQPGVYSFIAQGKNATSGIVLVEVYDAD